jgi:phosphoglucosamine mutase
MAVRKPPASPAARKLFGTDGVRGVANVHPMTGEMAMQLGRALAHTIRAGSHRHRVVVGKDTRLSGYMLEEALCSGIVSMGVDVLLTGPLPTPAIAFITSSMRADAGAVISASHNPYQDNGIKFFARDGFKLPDDLEARIEELIEGEALHRLRPTADLIGKAARIDDAGGRYVVFVKNVLPSKYTLDGLKIVMDCAHGAAYRVAPAIFSELGAEVVALGVDPDGRNINDDVGAVYPDRMCQDVKRYGADLGIALDGDADRVIVADEKGKVVDGDHIMAIIGRALLRKRRLARRTVVATVMSNMGLDEALASAGGSVVRTAVGDRYVVERMRADGYNFGGEQSGHLIFFEHATTGDGCIAALKLLEVMLDENKPLSALARVMESYPQTQVNVPVQRKPPVESLHDVQRALKSAEKKLGRRGRVLVRYSGTEMKARVLVEGPSERQNRALADDIADALRKACG